MHAIVDLAGALNAVLELLELRGDVDTHDRAALLEQLRACDTEMTTELAMRFVVSDAPLVDVFNQEFVAASLGCDATWQTSFKIVGAAESESTLTLSAGYLETLAAWLAHEMSLDTDHHYRWHDGTLRMLAIHASHHGCAALIHWLFTAVPAERLNELEPTYSFGYYFSKKDGSVIYFNKSDTALHIVYSMAALNDYEECVLVVLPIVLSRYPDDTTMLIEQFKYLAKNSMKRALHVLFRHADALGWDKVSYAHSLHDAIFVYGNEQLQAFAMRATNGHIKTLK